MKDYSSIFTPDDIQFIENGSNDPVTSFVLKFIGLAVFDKVINREYYNTIRQFDTQEKRTISSFLPIDQGSEIIITTGILQLSGTSYSASNLHASIRKLLNIGATPISDIKVLCYKKSDNLSAEILKDIQKHQISLAKTFSFTSNHCSFKMHKSFSVPTIYTTSIGIRRKFQPIDLKMIQSPLKIVRIAYGSNKGSKKRDQSIQTFSRWLMDQPLAFEPAFVDQQGLLPSLIRLMCQNNSGCSVKLKVPQNKAINWLGPKSNHGCVIIASPDLIPGIIKAAKQSEFSGENIGDITGEHSCTFTFNDGKRIEIPMEIFHHFHKHHFAYDIHKSAIKKTKTTLNIKPRKSYNSVFNKILENLDYHSYNSLVQMDTRKYRFSEESSTTVSGKKENSESIFAAVADSTKFIHQDPRLGGQIAVANALRQLACAGCDARSIILNNVLPRIEAGPLNNIQENGMAVLIGQEEAVRQFGMKILERSIYSNNEDFDQHIIAIGTKSEAHSLVTESFRDPGDFISILGSHRGELGGSLFADLYIKGNSHPVPSTDLVMERRLHDVLQQGIKGKLIKSATNVSQGGLALAIAHSIIRSTDGIGARIFLSRKLTNEELLFGETQGLIVISIGEKDIMEFERVCMRIGVPSTTIGRVTDTGRYTFNDLLNLNVKRFR